MPNSVSHEPFNEALSAGDYKFAGDWLVRSFASEVFGLCMSIVRDRSTAEDLSQEVFARAFAGLDGYRGEASARTWLLAIARNRCIDHVRSQQRWSGLDEDSDPDEHAEEISLPSSILARRTEIDAALQELSELERGLIVLRFRHGLAYEELAQAFGIKTGTARMRVSRALSKMRDSLQTPFGGLRPSASKEASGAAPAPAAAPSLPAARAAAMPAMGTMPGSPPSPAKKSRGLFRARREAPPAPPPAQAAPLPLAAPAPARHALSDYFEVADHAASQSLQRRLAIMVETLGAPT